MRVYRAELWCDGCNATRYQFTLAEHGEPGALDVLAENLERMATEQGWEIDEGRATCGRCIRRREKRNADKG